MTPYRTAAELPVEPVIPSPRKPLLCRIGLHFWDNAYEDSPDTTYCSQCGRIKYESERKS